MIETDAPLEPDYNRFDSFHETTSHPGMKNGAWTRAYADAWRKFYSLENMKAILLRTRPEKYWDVFFNLLWYKNSIVNEGIHPMLAGFVRLKDRVSRRPCFRRENGLAHLRRRIPEIFACVGGMLHLMLEMEELWLATRKGSETELRAWLLRLGRFPRTRRHLARFWITLRQHSGRGEIRTALRIDRIVLNALAEIRLATGFLAAMIAGRR